MKTTRKKRTPKKAIKLKKMLSTPSAFNLLETVEAYKVEEGIARTSGRHNETILRILKTMLGMEKAGQSFLIKTGDKAEAKRLHSAFTYVKGRYRNDLAKGNWSAMIVFDKGKQLGLRVFLD